MAFLAGPSYADSHYLGEDLSEEFDFIERDTWQEQAANLPDWPQDEDLIEFQVEEGGGPFRYYVDESSLQIGSDGVVRYVVVAESRSGSRNVSFEGIRCVSRGLIKRYAYGSATGFEPLTGTDWRPIEDSRGDAHRVELHRAICKQYKPRSRRDMLYALRHGSS